MVSVATLVEERLNGVETAIIDRLNVVDDRLNARLTRLETTLIDITRKLDA